MKVVLTGATGFVGSHVLGELREHGHEVVALVRDDAGADTVAAHGASPVVVDLHDRPAVVSLFASADGAIHTASPGDATSADLDSAVADAAIDALGGSGKPYVHISGLWIYGPNLSITEESPIDSPAIVAWREPIEERVLGARDMRGVVITSGTAYGEGGGGLPWGASRLTARRRRQPDHARQRDDSTGRRCTLADLADLFRRVLEDRLGPRSLRLSSSGLTPTVAVAHRGCRGCRRRSPVAVPGSDEEAQSAAGRLPRRGVAARS